MDLKLHDVTYNEDTIEVYELGDTLVVYATEKIGHKTVNTHIRLNKNAQNELYKALDKHLFGGYGGRVVEPLEPYETDDNKVMIDAEELRDKIKRDVNKGLTAQEIIAYLNGYIEGKKND